MSWADGLALAIRLMALGVWIAFYLGVPELDRLSIRVVQGLLVIGLACVAFGGLVPYGVVPSDVARFVYSGFATAALIVGSALFLEAHEVHDAPV